jgi:hypothetical protein
MTNHVLVENGIVVQSDRTGTAPEGYTEAPEWVTPGCVFDGSEFAIPAPLPPAVPESVSPAQAEIALYRYDEGVLLGRVNDLIASFPYEPVRIWWRKATYIARYHPYLIALAIELELSDETVDELFVVADLI